MEINIKIRNVSWIKNLFQDNESNVLFKNEDLRKEINFQNDFSNNYMRDSPFTKYFGELIEGFQEINKIHIETNPRNEFYYQNLMDIIKKRLHIAPLWSAFIISSESINFPHKTNLSRFTNNPVEAWFAYFRNHILNINKRVKLIRRLNPSEIIITMFMELSSIDLKEKIFNYYQSSLIFDKKKIKKTFYLKKEFCKQRSDISNIEWKLRNCEHLYQSDNICFYKSRLSQNKNDQTFEEMDTDFSENNQSIDFDSDILKKNMRCSFISSKKETKYPIINKQMKKGRKKIYQSSTSIKQFQKLYSNPCFESEVFINKEKELLGNHVLDGDREIIDGDDNLFKLSKYEINQNAPTNSNSVFGTMNKITENIDTIDIYQYDSYIPNNFPSIQNNFQSMGNDFSLYGQSNLCEFYQYLDYISE
ncbi:unnamed protein product [Brachionus calyciflorus]|uniref:Uncharacterized protein n=1 Tax=Brachionus calyciflorus TaxID=104777 RepID=A0A814KW28_9BILA|nr:unnamed protein product [Brachionus calyciflorus]